MRCGLCKGDFDELYRKSKQEKHTISLCKKCFNKLEKKVLEGSDEISKNKNGTN